MDVQLKQPAARRVNVGPGERKVSIATGLATLAYLLSRRPPVRMAVPMGLEAGYMLYRGATGHCVIYDMLEIDRADDGPQGIEVQRAVTINRPRNELFHIWRNFENLPRFMTHLKRVDVDEATHGRRSHWVANAPWGGEIEWDSEIIAEQEDEHLAWKSLPGSDVESIGSVQFSDAPDGRGTVVKVAMQYRPLAGSMGAAVAKLSGQEPGRQIHEDLFHFKQMMETGEIASVEGQSSGRNHQYGRSIDDRKRERDVVEEASAESFPASDAPGWISRKNHKQEVAE